MESSVLNYITLAFNGAVDIATRLFNSIPGAYTAVVWAVFVVLAMSMLIIPIRGFGVSAIAGGKSDLAKKNANSYESYAKNRARREASDYAYEEGL